MPVIAGELEPGARLREIPRHTPALQIHLPEIVLAVLVALVGRDREPFHRLDIVAGDANAAAIELTQPLSAGGAAVLRRLPVPAGGLLLVLGDAHAVHV